MSEWQEPAERGPQWEVVRVGAPERDAATRDLLAHLEAGRLTSVEYEDRTVQVSRATTWGIWCRSSPICRTRGHRRRQR